LPSTGTSCNRSILSLLLKGSCQGVVCRRNLCDSNAVKLMQLLLYDTRAVPYNREAPLTSGNKPKRERRRGGAKRNAQQAAAAAEQPAPQVVISSSPSVMVARARARGQCALPFAHKHCTFLRTAVCVIYSRFRLLVPPCCKRRVLRRTRSTTISQRPTSLRSPT
jgi:hypothetical protein